jgi:hypothetical protein
MKTSRQHIKDYCEEKNIEWIPIFYLEELTGLDKNGKITSSCYNIGVDKKGEWITTSKLYIYDNKYSEHTKKGFMNVKLSKNKPLLSLISFSYEELYHPLINLHSYIIPYVTNTFPIMDMIKAGFKQKGNFWWDNTFRWCSHLNNSQLFLLKDVFEKLIKSNYTPEWNFHIPDYVKDKARELLKNINTKLNSKVVNFCPKADPIRDIEVEQTIKDFLFDDDILYINVANFLVMECISAYAAKNKIIFTMMENGKPSEYNFKSYQPLGLYDTKQDMLCIKFNKMILDARRP